MVNNGSRVQNSCVTEKKNRWIINVVLVLAVVAFVGFSLIPLLSSTLGRNQSPEATPSPTQGATASRQAELEAQAKGYELVLQREPGNQTALRGLVDARIELGDIDGTIQPLEKLAELNPNQTEYVVLLAQAKQQTGDREGAAQAYRNVLASRPGDMNALQGLVALLLQQNRPEAAVGLLQDTLKTAPQANQIQAGSVDTTSVQLLLGQVYAEQERYDEAIAVYDEAIQSNRQDFRPILGKALILQTQGKDEEAKPLFTTAVSLAPAQYRDQINQLASGPTEAESNPDASPSEATPQNASPAGEATPAPSGN